MAEKNVYEAFIKEDDYESGDMLLWILAPNRSAVNKYMKGRGISGSVVQLGSGIVSPDGTDVEINEDGIAVNQ